MKKITILDLKAKKARGERITMLTAYSYPFAHFIDESEIDAVLVGDSLGMVELGYESTLPVTMEEMLHHTQAVKRAVRRAFLIGDMPFMSYQTSTEEAVKNACLFMKAGCDAVKLEGGTEVVDKIEAIVKAGVPVLGHIGLTPQRIAQLGGYKVQGKDIKTAQKLLQDAQELERAGVFGIVIECVPYQLTKLITQRCSVITIGIGSGPYCDGQVLVINDLLGITIGHKPKFVKSYANLASQIKEAISQFQKEVKEGSFPDLGHAYSLSDELWQEIKRITDSK